jgi:hypothetical protein
MAQFIFMLQGIVSCFLSLVVNFIPFWLLYRTPTILHKQEMQHTYADTAVLFNQRNLEYLSIGIETNAAGISIPASGISIRYTRAFRYRGWVPLILYRTAPGNGI